MCLIGCTTPYDSSAATTGVALAVTPQIAAGATHSIILKSDGTLWTCGSGTSGELGYPGGGIYHDEFKSVDGEARYTRIFSSSGASTCALRSDGALCIFNNNSYGLCANGTTIYPGQSIVVIPSDIPWRTVSPGNIHILAIKADGSLWAWGQNYYGELGNGTITPALTPVQIGTAKDWKVISAGSHTSFAIKQDGTLWAWGDNSSWQLGIGRTITDSDVPVQLGSDTDWASVSINDPIATAIKTDGSVWAWGSLFTYIDPATGGLNWSDVPRQVGTEKGWKKTMVSQRSLFMLKANGELWTTGGNVHGEGGYGSFYSSTEIHRTSGSLLFTDFQAGGRHVIAATATGEVYTWGDNTCGQLGLKKTTESTDTIEPVQISSTLDWKNAFAGEGFSFAIKADGSLWSWGLNNAGQLGLGTEDDIWSTPHAVGTSKNWSALSCGSYYVAGIQSDGTLWGWGANLNLAPQQIGSDSNWVSVSSGLCYSPPSPAARLLAIKTDGTLWAWGQNGGGALGVGNTDESFSVTVMTQIGTDTNWSEVATGMSISFAVKTDGSLWAWGDANGGRLGNNDPTPTNPSVFSPVRIGSDTDWIHVASGDCYGIAQKVDGSLWGWGVNNGQLGTHAPRGYTYSPVKIEESVKWVWGERAPGYALEKVILEDKFTQINTNNDTTTRHALAVKSDGSLWAWGDNNVGQYGTGNFWTPGKVDISL